MPYFPTPLACQMLRTSREGAAITVADLARELGIATKAVYAVEVGKNALPRTWIKRLPRALRRAVLRAYLEDLEAYRKETIAMADGKPPMQHLQITPAMLAMNRRDHNWMLRKDVRERVHKGESFDEIATALLLKKAAE